MTEPNTPSRARLLLNWGILIASLVGLGGAVWLFRLSLIEGEQAKKKGRAFRFTVKTAAVTRGTLRPTLRVQGDVVARRDTTLRAEVAGVVTSITAREGQAVQAGGEIARLDDRDSRLSLQRSQAFGMQANASVKRQEAALQKAKDLLRRLQRLDRDKLVSAEDLDNARLGVRTAEAALAEARAQAAQRYVEQRTAQQDLRRATVRAPFAGRISKRYVEVGDRVAVGTPLAELVGDRGVELHLYLPVSQVNRVRVGTKLRYRAAESSGRWIEAQVSRVLPKADPLSRNQTAVVAIPSPPDGIAPGLAVVAELEVSTLLGALIVSADALTRFGNQWVLFRVADGKAVRVPVQIVAQAGSRVAVTGPLQPGQPVVVVGNETLFPNAPVRVVPGGKMARNESPAR